MTHRIFFLSKCVVQKTNARVFFNLLFNSQILCLLQLRVQHLGDVQYDGITLGFFVAIIACCFLDNLAVETLIL